MRYITTWRKPAPNVLDWGHHTSEDIEEVERLVDNLLDRGVHQYRTYELGGSVARLSSTY